VSAPCYYLSYADARWNKPPRADVCDALFRPERGLSVPVGLLSLSREGAETLICARCGRSGPVDMWINYRLQGDGWALAHRFARRLLQRYPTGARTIPIRSFPFSLEPAIVDSDAVPRPSESRGAGHLAGTAGRDREGLAMRCRCWVCECGL